MWAVKIDTPDRDLKAEIFKEAWEVKEPEADHLASSVVDDFITALFGLEIRASGGRKQRSSRHGASDVVFELTGPDDKLTKIKAVLKPVEDNLIAVETDDGPIMLVDRQAFLKVIPEAVRPVDQPDQKDKQPAQD